MVNKKVNIVFGNLNSGGGEGLTLVTMKATSNTSVKFFDPTTFYNPRISRLEKTFEEKLSSVMTKLRQIYITSMLISLKNQMH